jgi:hypothetical protein
MPGCGGARCGGRADAAAPAAPAECGRGGGRRSVRREEAQHAMASTSVDVVRCGAMWCYVLTRRWGADTAHTQKKWDGLHTRHLLESTQLCGVMWCGGYVERWCGGGVSGKIP